MPPLSVTELIEISRRTGNPATRELADALIRSYLVAVRRGESPLAEIGSLVYGVPDGLREWPLVLLGWR